MSTTNQYPHLVVDEQGVARIDGSRYKVVHLAAEHFHYGWSAEELLRQHPDLKPEEVHSALTYFYDHRDQMVELIKSAGELESDSAASGLSRAELMKRHRS